ncbi:hypothetical protein CEXT_722301 [Caerostris extrusa]|uniref:Uncharacterized protein n=1 Tax=Caerostris extrusa TaxID=172846 RepID=A0AAV4VJ30_CAEEX|nr:hypothetical protein CEXT_722301 [Caerostris extrusa]
MNSRRWRSHNSRHWPTCSRARIRGCHYVFPAGNEVLSKFLVTIASTLPSLSWPMITNVSYKHEQNRIRHDDIILTEARYNETNSFENHKSYETALEERLRNSTAERGMIPFP